MKLPEILKEIIEVDTENPPPEIYYHVMSEMDYIKIDYRKTLFECKEFMKTIKLVYQYERKISDCRHLYKFAGWRK